MDYLPWNVCSPEMIRRKVVSLLACPEPYREAIRRFKLTGIDVMRQRVQAFRDNRP